MKNIVGKQKICAVICALLLVTLILTSYSNTFQSPPVLDDLHSFVDEPDVQVESLTLPYLTKLTQTKFGFSRSLPMASFAWDYYWGKGHISAFHLTNLLIHIACMFAVMWFLYSLFRCVDFQVPAREIFPLPVSCLVLIIAGIWALNPLQTNAVTYIVQRMTSMTTLFYLLSITAYLNGRMIQKQLKSRGVAWLFFVVAVITALAAFLSKQISATLPVMIVISEIFFFTPDLLQRIFLRKRLLYLIIICGLVFGIYLCGWFIPDVISAYDHRHFTLLQRLLTEVRVVVSYIFLLLLPLPCFLNLDCDVPLSTSLLSPIETAYSIIILIFLLIVIWKTRKRNCLIAYGLIWFLINLMIESTIIALELKFEHRLYLPSIGFYLSLVLIVVAGFKRFIEVKNKELVRASIICFSLIIFSVLSIMTYVRNNAWHDKISIYTDCVVKSPNKARPHSNLSQAYGLVGNYEKSAEEAERAISCGIDGYEEYWVAACNIISSYNALGELNKAVDRGEELFQNAPSKLKQNAYPLFLINMGTLHILKEDYAKAYEFYLKAFDFSVRCSQLPYLSSQIESNIMNLLMVVSEKDKHFATELHLIENDPASAVGHIGRLYFDYGKNLKALDFCQLGLVENPESPECLKLKNEINLVVAENKFQKQKGTLKEKYFFHPFESRFNFVMAIAYVLEKNNLFDNLLLSHCLSKAEILNPASTDLLILKSWRFYKQGNYEKALALIDKGIDLDPKKAHLWINRGIYSLSAGRGEEAVLALEKALVLYPGYPHKYKVKGMISAAKKF